MGTDVGIIGEICGYGKRTLKGPGPMALTIKEIDGAKPTDKPYKLADGGGLCLLIPPSGAKLWRWRYRVDGKEKMMALGEYPLVSLKEARERHSEARKALANGIDPMAERKAEGKLSRKKPKLDSAKRRTALRTSRVSGGSGGWSASLHDTPIRQCGAWRLMYSLRTATNPSMRAQHRMCGNS